MVGFVGLCIEGGGGWVFLVVCINGVRRRWLLMFLLFSIAWSVFCVYCCCRFSVCSCKQRNCWWKDGIVGWMGDVGSALVDMMRWIILFYAFFPFFIYLFIFRCCLLLLLALYTVSVCVCVCICAVMLWCFALLLFLLCTVVDVPLFSWIYH